MATRFVFIFFLLTFCYNYSKSQDTTYNKTKFNTIGHYPSDFIREIGDGLVLYFGNYSDSVRTGEWIYFYPDGKILAKGKYRNNKKYGLWFYYSIQGGERKIKWTESATIREEYSFEENNVQLIDVATPGPEQTIYKNGMPVIKRHTHYHFR